jgi:hypothetical protein
MRQIFCLTTAVLLTASAMSGCSCGEPVGSRDAGPGGGDGGPVDGGPVDGGPQDGGPDGGGSDAGPMPPGSGTTGTFQSAGGGTATSAEHRLRFSIGAPQPMGTSTSADGILQAGPAAAGR